MLWYHQTTRLSSISSLHSHADLPINVVTTPSWQFHSFTKPLNTKFTHTSRPFTRQSIICDLSLSYLQDILSTRLAPQNLSSQRYACSGTLQTPRASYDKLRSDWIHHSEADNNASALGHVGNQRRSRVSTLTTSSGGSRDARRLSQHGIRSKESEEGLGRVWRTRGLPEFGESSKNVRGNAPKHSNNGAFTRRTRQWLGQGKLV